jgi:CheY-like chemotaxis protein
MQVQLTAQEFLRDLRSALAHLYEPLELKRSRLAKAFQLETSADRSAALRQALQDGIQALKAEGATPVDSPSARAYEVLYYRYIEQSALKEVAAELALSVRQVHRIETSGLAYLSEYFQAKYHLTFLSDGTGTTPAANPQTNELEWLRKSSRGEDVNLSTLLESVIGTIRPLTQQKHIGIQVHCESGQTWVRGDPTILRQVVMNSLLAAIQVNPDADFTADVSLRSEGIALTVANVNPLDISSHEPKMNETVASIRQLMELTGGKVETNQLPGRAFRLSLIFPARKCIQVLVVDDNADALRLMERYLTGTGFQYLGVREPEKVGAMLQEHRPQILILDVMLPGIDGWQLLSRLNEAGLLKDTQVVISTILPQESLALAFHAAAFLRKPVTRENLLATLAQLSSPADS